MQHMITISDYEEARNFRKSSMNKKNRLGYLWCVAAALFPAVIVLAAMIVGALAK